jgi:hypothetical protein
MQGWGVSRHLDGQIDGLVLFQTDTHDIIVIQWTTERLFWVLERETGDVEKYGGGIARTRFWVRFEDIDRDRNMELRIVQIGSRGTGLRHWKYHIYDSTDGFDSMLEVDARHDDHTCPSTQERFRNPEENKSLVINDTSKFPKVRRFRMWRQLAVGLGECRFTGGHPQFERTCRFDPETRRFDCKDRVLQTAELKLEDFPLENLEWALENRGRLRREGFRFSERFVKRAKRRLEEGVGE